MSYRGPQHRYSTVQYYGQLHYVGVLKSSSGYRGQPNRHWASSQSVSRPISPAKCAGIRHSRHSHWGGIIFQHPIPSLCPSLSFCLSFPIVFFLSQSSKVIWNVLGLSHLIPPLAVTMAIPFVFASLGGGGCLQPVIACHFFFLSFINESLTHSVSAIEVDYSHLTVNVT